MFQPKSFAKSGSALLLLMPVNGEFVVSGVTPMAFSNELRLSGATVPLDVIMPILLRLFPAGVGSAKNIAFRLLEAWRNLRLNADQIQNILDARLQIRFVPP